MSIALILALIAGVMQGTVAVLSLGFASAPGCARYRTFAVVAVTAALYGAAEGLMTTDVPAGTILLASHAQAALAALHVAAWYSYSVQELGLPQGRSHNRVWGVMLAVGALGLVPGLFLDGSLIVSEVAWLGLTYRIATPTAVGAAAFVLELGLLAVPLSHFVRAWRMGRPDAPVRVAALGAIYVTGLHDAVVSLGLFASPLLLSSGFVVSVMATGWLLTRAFVRNTLDLERLSRRLEHDVAVGTEALVSAEASLLRAEKMAALGRLSAGVAHEINNPAAVVAANLTYLRESLGEGAVPRDVVACLDESIQSVDRIAAIVRQLLDSGRAAASGAGDDATVSVLSVAKAAVVLARPSVPEHVTVEIDVPCDLHVRAREEELVQVLVNLVANGAHAIPAGRFGGRVEVLATVRDDQVLIEVRDDGSGMTDETRRRLFEPFFTTKPFGKGTGLGLSVSLGLVRSMGGDLRVDSSPEGTSMTIVLPVASGVPTSDEAVRAAPCFRRVLLVDDDRAVAKAIARALGPSFDVQLASGPIEALAKLHAETVDLVLSDLQMPDGGGRWLYEALASVDVPTSRRMIVFTGGAPSEADRAFFEARGVPILAKPLVLDVLVEAANRVCTAADAAERASSALDRGVTRQATPRRPDRQAPKCSGL